MKYKIFAEIAKIVSQKATNDKIEISLLNEIMESRNEVWKDIYTCKEKRTWSLIRILTLDLSN